ncbi:MAG TPA: LuxR C-terminal-related transcriptional regulator [Acidimicrobiia bacterium]|nr:LuxR C-terminal-related transcriptional regulator [Acidimicrobiia bacterium]
MVMSVRRSGGPAGDAVPLVIPWSRAVGLTGLLIDTETEVENAYRWSLDVADEEVRVRCAALLGRASLSRGHVHRAGRFLREAVERTAVSDRDGKLASYLAAAAQSAALAGNVRLAEKLLFEAEALAGDGPCPHREELFLARVWLVASRGELSRAASLAFTSGHEASARGRRGVAALAFHEAVRLGAAATVADRLNDLAGDAADDEVIVRAFAHHATALRARDAVGLGMAAGRFESLGADLLAAEAWTEASAVYRKQGHVDGAAAATTRAQTTLDRCEGARTPALVPQAVLAPTLTPRQRDVAALVAGGLSNREVAGKLYVSLRTVENHLYQVYAKLGVSDRKDLAREWGTPPI